MPVHVTINLITETYDAGDAVDPLRAEWPPHPARLFCALLSAARTGPELAALAWLERQPPPIIRAAAAARSLRRAGYVVTNEIVTGAGSQTHPGRTNGIRVRARAVPASARVCMTWDVKAEPDVVTTLDAVATRIPYLGRSTGIALVGASVSDAANDADAQEGTVIAVHEPCTVAEADGEFRVPYPGYLAELVALHERGRPAWEASRQHGYRVRWPAAPEDEPGPFVPSVYGDVIAFRFAGLRPDGRLAGRFAAALRSQVLSNAHGEAPNALHGHDADGRPHVAFLALPDVGSDHSDGHLLGLAVAVPHLEPAERKVVLRSTLALRPDPQKGFASLGVKGLGEVDLLYDPGLYRPWGATPQRWRRGSTRWASATPVIFDRHPKTNHTVEAEIARSCRTVGLPNPTRIDVSRTPLLSGAVHMHPVDIPRKFSGRPFAHVQLEFDRTVSGPVLLGAGRYLGIGLLAPLTEGTPS